MASIDLIKASNGAGDAVQATVTSARVIGATTLKVNDVTNFPEGQFIGTTGTIDNTGVFDPATLTVFTAHLSGADVEIDAIAPGYADLGNTNGQVLVIKPNTLWADNLADTLAVSHNTDGTLKNNIVTTAKIADSNVTTAKIANASVTADKIDFTTFRRAKRVFVADSTGVKTITGLGFRPSKVTTYAAQENNASIIIYSNGMAYKDGATITQFVSASSGYTSGPATEMNTKTDETIFFGNLNSPNNAGFRSKGVITSFDADGITFNVTEAHAAFNRYIFVFEQ